MSNTFFQGRKLFSSLFTDLPATMIVVKWVTFCLKTICWIQDLFQKWEKFTNVLLTHCNTVVHRKRARLWSSVSNNERAYFANHIYYHYFNTVAFKNYEIWKKQASKTLFICSCFHYRMPVIYWVTQPRWGIVPDLNDDARRDWDVVQLLKCSQAYIVS